MVYHYFNLTVFSYPFYLYKIVIIINYSYYIFLVYPSTTCHFIRFYLKFLPSTWTNIANFLKIQDNSIDKLSLFFIQWKHYEYLIERDKVPDFATKVFQALTLLGG